jgi:hypothetical protein
MSAIVTIDTNGNHSVIMVKYQMGFSNIPVATSNLERALKNVIVNLANHGYNVIVRD